MHAIGILEVAGDLASLCLYLPTFLLHKGGIWVKYMVILQNSYSSIIAIPMIPLWIEIISILFVAKFNADTAAIIFPLHNLGLFFPSFKFLGRTPLSVKLRSCVFSKQSDYIEHEVSFLPSRKCFELVG